MSHTFDEMSCESGTLNGTKHERRRVWKRPVSFVLCLLDGWKVCFRPRRHAAASEHPLERRGPRPASKEGRPVLTTAPWSQDHGGGNTGRLPLRSAVEGVLREALRASAACLRPPFVSRLGWFRKGGMDRSKLAGHFLSGRSAQSPAPAFYAQKFPTAEVNYSFYHPSKPETYAKWVAQIPEGFLFSVKASRLITPTKQLRDMEEPWETFVSNARSLGTHPRPILLQFPPTSPNLRFHSRTKLFASSNPEAELAEEGKKIKRCLRDGLGVYAYFNDDEQGRAVSGARMLTRLVEGRSKW